MSKPGSTKRRKHTKIATTPIAHKTCPASGGKVSYPGRKRALTAMNATAALQASGKTRPCEVYKCRYCGDWHMTSHPTLDPRRLK